MPFFLQDKVDYESHNAEVRRVWEAYHAGHPYRVPVFVNGSITNYLLNPVLNTYGWTFKDFFENPEVQIQAQLEYQKWQRFNICCDREMGLLENWSLIVDFQNCVDPGWMGCPLHYLDDQTPDTDTILCEDKNALYDLPESLPQTNGLIGRALEFYEYMVDRCRTLEFEGKPVQPPVWLLGEFTDGPLGLAYKLRGADNILVDMLIDEEYYHDLMGYITRNLISRMKKMREIRWAKDNTSADYGQYRTSNFYFADDAIALISVEHYKEFVYPYHKMIFDEFSIGQGDVIHLCGDATRHFKFLKEALNVRSFDTGFPVDHAWLREQLGPDVEILGGPAVMDIKYGNEESIHAGVKRICASGVMVGGRFVMIAANNMAPGTPVENVKALYEATKEYGRI